MIEIFINLMRRLSTATYVLFTRTNYYLLEVKRSKVKVTKSKRMNAISILKIAEFHIVSAIVAHIILVQAQTDSRLQK